MERCITRSQHRAAAANRKVAPVRGSPPLKLDSAIAERSNADSASTVTRPVRISSSAVLRITGHASQQAVSAAKSALSKPSIILQRNANAEAKLTVTFNSGQSTFQEPADEASMGGGQSGDVEQQIITFGETQFQAELQRRATGPFQCALCPKHFTTNGSLARHHKLVHRRGLEEEATGDVFRCAECHLTFALLYKLKSHQFVHVTSRSHQCQLCGKAYKRQYELKRHHRHAHTAGQAELPFGCDICGKRFAFRSYLRTHTLNHGEKRHRCEQCGRSFTKRTNLEMHQRVHSGEKPFGCAHCDKSFAKRYNAQRHERGCAGGAEAGGPVN